MEKGGTELHPGYTWSVIVLTISKHSSSMYNMELATRIFQLASRILQKMRQHCLTGITPYTPDSYVLTGKISILLEIGKIRSCGFEVIDLKKIIYLIALISISKFGKSVEFHRSEEPQKCRILQLVTANCERLLIICFWQEL